MIERIKLLLKTQEGRKLSQRIMIGIVFAAITSGIIYWIVAIDEPSKSQKAVEQQEPLKIESAGKHINPDEVWRLRVEEDQANVRKQAGQLRKTLEDQAKETMDYSQNQIAELRLQLSALQQTLLTQNQKLEEMAAKSNTQAIESTEAGDGIMRIDFKLAPQKKALKYWQAIPAGAFAKAVLLSGVDASTALQSAADPQPVLIKITDFGKLPRQFKGDLKECHCTASAYGDLSSERVYMRLEKLSCITKSTGELVETDVAGYVTGSDGKAGVRGIVFSKEGKYLGRSLAGGILSGVAGIANPQSRQGNIGALAQGPDITLKDQAISGVTQGGASALDKLAKYYIARAEQLQPVIQIPGGQEVDIVFTKSAPFGSQTTKEEILQEREQSRTAEAVGVPQQEGSGE